eukprot:CAMPEP_0172540944 /NCGR_PEP_ID=MMETSP1067-20121228/11842_1 /TAXON_ID=265564 ORGANISM="Thalassiosira punctigera, Strain Tpunct2005C2" /NCGR_SAMPLE_ID=MMETSP1067 /ASSEMBLY_ACC=CAM_ASM_000444 /LENGTH=49 /DNA_ID=CAMNT_0013326881 /DNA_START=195 /DNA_END=344 /DNA_ORIENTATION=-
MLVLEQREGRSLLLKEMDNSRGLLVNCSVVSVANDLQDGTPRAIVVGAE